MCHCSLPKACSTGEPKYWNIIDSLPSRSNSFNLLDLSLFSGLDAQKPKRTCFSSFILMAMRKFWHQLAELMIYLFIYFNSQMFQTIREAMLAECCQGIKENEARRGCKNQGGCLVEEADSLAKRCWLNGWNVSWKIGLCGKYVCQRYGTERKKKEQQRNRPWLQEQEELCTIGRKEVDWQRKKDMPRTRGQEAKVTECSSV